MASNFPNFSTWHVADQVQEGLLRCGRCGGVFIYSPVEVPPPFELGEGFYELQIGVTVYPAAFRWPIQGCKVLAPCYGKIDGRLMPKRLKGPWLVFDDGGLLTLSEALKQKGLPWLKGGLGL